MVTMMIVGIYSDGYIILANDGFQQGLMMTNVGKEHTHNDSTIRDI